jgi:hypothetical protein
VVLVSVVLPCVDFAGEDFLIGDAITCWLLPRTPLGSDIRAAAVIIRAQRSRGYLIWPYEKPAEPRKPVCEY